MLRVHSPDIVLKARELQKTLRCECGAEFSIQSIVWCLRRNTRPKRCWSCKHR